MKNQVLYLYDKKLELQNATIITKIGMVRESLLSSVLSDIFTFIMLISLFCANAYFIHSRLFSVLILVMFFVTAKRGTKKVTKDELLKILNEAIEN